MGANDGGRTGKGWSKVNGRMSGELRITTKRLITNDDRTKAAPGTVRIRDGKVVGVDRAMPPAGGRLIDVGNLVVMPGVIDAHVHVNEPGRTEWEGFKTAGRAAAAGGVTMMVVMPLNCSPVATSVAALQGEAAAAAGVCAVDYGFWGGVVPGNLGELRPMWEAGVLGFKCFMVHSGLDEFPGTAGDDLDRAVRELAGLTPGGAPLLVHAEDPGIIAAAAAVSGLAEAPTSYSAYLASRPPRAEVKAIETMIALCRRHKSRVHIVHVATADALDVLREARAGGEVAITAETCPHYLTFVSETIDDGATEFKCAPPIRGRANREGLWRGLTEGVLDLIASDHSPCPPEMKLMERGDFANAWGGVSSLQLSLPAVWTEAHERGVGLEQVSRWLSRAPAKLAGIDAFKGRIAPGYDADIVVWDPEARWTVRGAALQHRHTVTPYDGRSLLGVVHATFLRGEQVYSGPAGQRSTAVGDGFRAEAIGRWVKRTRT